MTKSKKTKKALLASVLSMMLCVAMLAGSTFAWFTDTAGSDNNRIKAGNLRINLVGINDEELGEDALFGENTKWEPGQVYYRELKVVNEGTLAAKFAVNLDETSFKANCALEPDVDFDENGALVEPELDEDGNPLVDEDGNLVDEDGNLLVDHKGYANTPFSLSDVIRLTVYPGSYEELVKAVNGKKDKVDEKYKELKTKLKGLEVDDEDYEYTLESIKSCEKYLAGYEYSADDRSALEIALELNDLLGTEVDDDDEDSIVEGAFFLQDGMFVPASEEGFYLEGTLAPKDKEITVTETETDPETGSETETTKIIKDHKEFTLIAYWPEGGEIDNTWNLKNGRKATNLMRIDQFEPHANGDFKPEYKDVRKNENGEPIITVDGKTELDILDDLRIEFDIIVYATQTPYEKDSFDINYDVNAEYDLPPAPPAP